MTQNAPAPDLEVLLAHAGWLRGLASCLVADRDEADDLVQETLVTASRSPPARDRPARPWLGEVMRNLRKMSLRSAGRRRAREERAALPDPPAPTDVLLEGLELQRLLARLVGELEEPYRSTILWRFYEGRTSRAIAAVAGVPAGTVRWRLAEGVRRLRARLDATYARSAWSLALLPLARESGRPAIGAGPLALGAAATVLVGLTAVLLFATRAPHPAAPAARPAVTSLARPTPAPAPATHNDTERELMHANARKAAAFLGIALPALVASADDAQKPLTRDAAINACIAYKERALSCKEELADHFAAFAPAERRASFRAKALAEIVAEGSGPLAPRRAKCTLDVDRKAQGRPPFGIFTTGDLSALEACDKESDCKARLACSQAVVGAAKKRAEAPR